MIASGKGGTGKSTIATYLATEFALSGFKTFLTELDMGLRSIDVISGVSDKSVYDIGDVLTGVSDIKQAIITSPHTDNLHIMPAPAKRISYKPENLKKITDSIYNSYDYIIIDTAAGIGDAFAAALPVAKTAVIVCNADIVSVRDARIVSDEIYSSGIKDIRLVINKYDKNTFRYSGFTDGDQIIDACCAQLLGLIPYDINIQVASMDGNTLSRDGLSKKIFSAMCDRLQGKHTPMIVK